MSRFFFFKKNTLTYCEGSVPRVGQNYRNYCEPRGDDNLVEILAMNDIHAAGKDEVLVDDNEN